MKVLRSPEGPRLSGDGPDVQLANRYLQHLGARRFAPATIRTYAFHLLSFLRFEEERGLDLTTTVPTDIFDFLEWLGIRRQQGKTVVAITATMAASPSTMNQRIAALRGLFEYAVVTGARESNPVPTARRASGLAAKPRGLLGHLSTGRRRAGGHLVKESRRLPESLEPTDVSEFLIDLNTHRDRAMTLAMVLGGLRAAEVRSLLLRDVDMGVGRLRIMGKGNRERQVPVDRAFFGELAAYLRVERPPDCATPECFVVLRGPTSGEPISEAGLRRIFRTHRISSGSLRVRPHRLRHTYGTELASAGMDLLVLRELMGHVSPETTARYVHLSPTTLADEYDRARSAR